MSIIAIAGVPNSWDVRQMVAHLAKCIRGHFEGLSIIYDKFKARVGYIRLPVNLDPSRVIQSINKTKFKVAKKNFVRLRAVVPDHVPDLPYSNPEPVPRSAQKRYKIPPLKNNAELIVDTVTELLVELQSKYTGLNKLSQKTQHKLLTDIAMTILERLKKIVSTGERDLLSTGFLLTKAYRKSHPHFADFQLILSTLHRIEDAQGAPRTQLLEHELAVVPKDIQAVGNVSVEKINSTCNKYVNKIIVKVQEHINMLRKEMFEPAEDIEAAARKVVKEEFVNMSPYISEIIRSTLSPKSMPPALKSSPLYRMRMYGEPFLPSKEALTPIMSNLRAQRVQRSDFIYNMLKFNINRQRYSSAIALDSTVVGSAKLVVRPSEMDIYILPPELQEEMKAMVQ